MTVKELREALAKIDGDAYVVINDLVVVGIEEVRGRVGGAKHWPDTFRRVENGRDKAVVFLRHTEFSDGTYGLIASH